MPVLLLFFLFVFLLLFFVFVCMFVFVFYTREVSGLFFCHSKQKDQCVKFLEVFFSFKYSRARAPKAQDQMLCYRGLELSGAFNTGT